MGIFGQGCLAITPVFYHSVLDSLSAILKHLLNTTHAVVSNQITKEKGFSK
jgi:hypothetical protein